MNEKQPKKEPKLKPGRPPRHGGYSLINRGDLLEKRPQVRAYLSAVRDGLIRDLGPREQDLSTAQLAIINHTISKLGVLRLIEEHVQKNGIFTDGQLDPALGKFWLAASNSLRLDLMALGINTKKGEEALSLEKYIVLKAKPAPGHSEQNAAAAEPGQPPSEIEAPRAAQSEIQGPESAGASEHD